MRFLLDTCTISAHVRRPAGIQSRFLQYAGRLYVPSVALAELYVLAYRLDDPTPRLDAIEAVIRDEVAVSISTRTARVPAAPARVLMRAGPGSRRSTC